MNTDQEDRFINALLVLAWNSALRELVGDEPWTLRAATRQLAALGNGSRPAPADYGQKYIAGSGFFEVFTDEDQLRCS